MSTMNLRVLPSSLAKASTELLVVGVFENSLQTGAVGLLDSNLSGRISSQAQAENFQGKLGQLSVQFTHPQLAAKRLLLFGVGSREKLTRDRLRNALVTALKEVKRLKISRVIFGDLNLVEGKVDICDYAYLIAETAGMVDYVINHQKTVRGGHEPETRLTELAVLAQLGNHEAILESLEEGATVAASVNHARDLVNMPPSTLTPRKLAEYAKQAEAESRGAIKVVVHDKQALVQMGAEALLAVSRGSEEEPVLIEMSYFPAEADPRVTLALIGKSVTFDSGGLDLKPADGMRNMKCDMAGGAATLAAIIAIAKLKLPVRVKVYMAATENMVGCKPYKPGDVINTMAGLTVEIDNTDAEGRLTLADAIEKARRDSVTHIVDMATLTGAVRMSCGIVGAGAFGNTPDFTSQVLSSSEAVGERLAVLPMWDEIAEANRSSMADLKNSGGASFGAGSSTAAWFLRRFAVDTPWVHLDIASVAFRESERGADPAGGTGWGVRTAVQLVRNFAAQAKK